ncbi:MAG: DUF2785 domain-containing protein [Myxococcota bacterium]
MYLSGMVIVACGGPATVASSRQPMSPPTVGETALPENCRGEKALAHWQQIKAQYATIDGNLHAVSLAGCLAASDPRLRDGVAYELLTYWFRKASLRPSVRSEVLARLLPWLNRGEGAPGKHAIARAFSALVLSEVVRSDGKSSWLTESQRLDLHEASIAMFARERDYRGLDPTIGWVHAVAHGADLLWRLAAHPETTVEQQRAQLTVLRPQIARPGLPPYVFNESDRLARVVTAIVLARQVPAGELRTWVEALSDPTPMARWAEAFRSPAGMARLHNVKQFLRALREESAKSQTAGSLLAAVDEALDALP